jgi:hypothetical protein
MPPPLFLEPLEERALLSGASAALTAPARPDAPAGAVGPAAPREDQAPTGHRDADGGTATRVGAAGEYRQATPTDARREDDAEYARGDAEIDVVSRLLVALHGGVVDGGPEEVVTRKGALRDDAAAARLGPSFTTPAAGQPPPPVSAGPPEAVEASAGTGRTDEVEELAGPGPLADTLFLDGWREGLPPPRADLVPAVGGGLTPVPAYLVGPAVPWRASEAVPPREGEPGLTDFIVGHEGRRPRPTDLRTATAAEGARRPGPARLEEDGLPGVVGPRQPLPVVGRRDEGLNEPPSLPAPSAGPDEPGDE